MSGGLLLAHFYSQPWAVLDETYLTMRSVLHRWASGSAIDHGVIDRIQADKSVRSMRMAESMQAGGSGVAVLPLYGILVQRGQVEDVSGPGVTSLQQFASNFRNAVDDAAVSSILIDIDSPGGGVFGVGELADEIRACKKPVVAIANAMAASAAYWIGSACKEFYCTPSGLVGSIGVFSCHWDESKALEMEGLNPTIISAGKYKVEGHSYGPMDEECASFVQSTVDAYYGQFVAAVSKGRGVPVAAVRDGMGQGRTLLAKDALSEKMIDGILSFGDLTKKMVSKTFVDGRSANTQSHQQARLNSAKRNISLLA
ncbi:MAG: S49 family peptidase [Magnetococcales bacterium]|nr:S49 family peptidase [Magnetococcales bacterium]